MEFQKHDRQKYRLEKRRLEGLYPGTTTLDDGDAEATKESRPHGCHAFTPLRLQQFIQPWPW